MSLACFSSSVALSVGRLSAHRNNTFALYIMEEVKGYEGDMWHLFSPPLLTKTAKRYSWLGLYSSGALLMSNGSPLAISSHSKALLVSRERAPRPQEMYSVKK